jgi:ATP adenylyltransferase/5',5'''-P-1,P-4-tetraphosphate phosphorylase II
MHDTTTQTLADRARDLLVEQKATWPTAHDNYAALTKVQNRTIQLDGFDMRLQFNPARIVSSGAKIDPKAIAERKCFLCNANRPKEQTSLAFGDDYLILVNPFPIFPEHFTIANNAHVPQLIAGNFKTLLDLARALAPRYTVFYNGPRAGASAPDHLHFQAGDRGFMTIESEVDRLKGNPSAACGVAKIHAIATQRPFIFIESTSAPDAAVAFARVTSALNDIAPQEDEPSANVLVWSDSGVLKIVILPRAKHRPDFYYAEGDAKILLSPGSVDLGGVCIMPVERDYHRLTADHLRQMLSEVMFAPDRFALLSQRIAQTVK